jgi:hypothetical protein
MLNRIGARNISCSVIRSHRIRNGFSTSLGSNVVLIETPRSEIGPIICAAIFGKHQSSEQRFVKHGSRKALRAPDSLQMAATSDRHAHRRSNGSPECKPTCLNNNIRGQRLGVRSCRQVPVPVEPNQTDQA